MLRIELCWILTSLASSSPLFLLYHCCIFLQSMCYQLLELTKAVVFFSNFLNESTKEWQVQVRHAGIRVPVPAPYLKVLTSDCLRYRTFPRILCYIPGYYSYLYLLKVPDLIIGLPETPDRHSLPVLGISVVRQVDGKLGTLPAYSTGHAINLCRG